MTKYSGRELLVKLRVSTGPDVFSTLCGLTTKSITINNNEIDVTTPDCADPGGILWTEVLAGAKRVSVSGNGFFEDSAAENTLRDRVMASKAEAYLQIIVPGFGTFAGMFFFNSVEYSGEMEGGVAYAIALASTGPVTFTAA